MYNGIVSSKKVYYGQTNAEIIAATDARSSDYSVNYIYDTFSWDHCGDDYSISTLLDTLNTEYSAVKAGLKSRESLPWPKEHQMKAKAKLQKVVEDAKKRIEMKALKKDRDLEEIYADLERM
jgi:hypothetical protein